MSNPQMASLFEHGASFSPNADRILRAVLHDATTPLSALGPVIEEWNALDPARAPSDPVAALAPILVWSCTRDTHAKIAHAHVFKKWAADSKQGLDLKAVLQDTHLIARLTSCLLHISSIPFGPSHTTAIASCVFYAVDTATAKFETFLPIAPSVSDALDTAKNALLVGLLNLTYTLPTRQWSNEALRSSIRTRAQTLWSKMSNHLTAACAHNVLDLDIPPVDKLEICYQLSSWAWTTHQLRAKILPLLPEDPYARALAVHWGGKPAPVGKDQALAGVRINRVLAEQYVPELHDMMLLANQTIGAWRSKKAVLGLLSHFAPKTQEPMELPLPADMEFTP